MVWITEQKWHSGLILNSLVCCSGKSCANIRGGIQVNSAFYRIKNHKGPCNNINKCINVRNLGQIQWKGASDFVIKSIITVGLPIFTIFFLQLSDNLLLYFYILMLHNTYSTLDTYWPTVLKGLYLNSFTMWTYIHCMPSCLHYSLPFSFSSYSSLCSWFSFSFYWSSALSIPFLCFSSHLHLTHFLSLINYIFFAVCPGEWISSGVPWSCAARIYDLQSGEVWKLNAHFLFGLLLFFFLFSFILLLRLFMHACLLTNSTRKVF